MKIFWFGLAVATMARVVESDAFPTLDKVSNILSDFGNTLKHSAQNVKQQVTSGYNYLKTKITHTTNSCGDYQPYITPENTDDAMNDPFLSGQVKLATAEPPAAIEPKITAGTSNGSDINYELDARMSDSIR